MLRIGGSHLVQSSSFSHEASSLHQSSYSVKRALYTTGYRLATRHECVENRTCLGSYETPSEYGRITAG